MARRPQTSPRKEASQARSRATVDALVEATARILVRDGFEGASTNRIAETAGVSVGSLYQYFPGKEALVAAVIARHNREIMAVVRRALAEAEALPFEQGLRRLVAAGVEGHRVDPTLHAVLAEQTPRTGGLANAEVFNGETHGRFRAYLERHRAAVGAADLDLAAFVCVTCIEALTHTAVLHRPDLVSDRAVEGLVEEATRLVLAYLRPADSGS